MLGSLAIILGVQGQEGPGEIDFTVDQGVPCARDTPTEQDATSATHIHAGLAAQVISADPPLSEPAPQTDLIIRPSFVDLLRAEEIMREQAPYTPWPEGWIKHSNDMADFDRKETMGIVTNFHEGRISYNEALEQLMHAVGSCDGSILKRKTVLRIWKEFLDKKEVWRRSVMGEAYVPEQTQSQSNAKPVRALLTAGKRYLDGDDSESEEEVRDESRQSRRVGR